MYVVPDDITYAYKTFKFMCVFGMYGCSFISSMYLCIIMTESHCCCSYFQCTLSYENSMTYAYLCMYVCT